MKSLLLSCLTLISAVTSVSAADMQYPLDVLEVDKTTTYVADRNLPGVWKVSEGKAEIFFEGSKKFRTPLNAIRCLALDHEGKLLAGDSATREVYRFDENNKPVPLTKGRIGIPMAMAVAKTGEIYVADLELHRIWKVPAAGGEPKEVAQVAAPRGMTIDSDGQLWIVSHGPNHVVKLNPENGSITTVVEGMAFEFGHDIIIQADKTAYVVDGYGKTVWKIAPGESPAVFVKGEPFKNPVGLSLSENGLLVADPHQKMIYQVSPEGKIAPVLK